jgi:CheY-like chemotaxis protein
MKRYATLAGAQEAVPPAGNPTRGARVLVLEDDADVQQIWVEALERAGYAAVGTASGADALARLPELSPDLIVLDMMMPGMDGFEFLARLRARLGWARIPVLIVSGIGSTIAATIDRDGVETLGVAGILPKPVDVEILVEEARRITREERQ